MTLGRPRPRLDGPTPEFISTKAAVANPELT